MTAHFDGNMTQSDRQKVTKKLGLSDLRDFAKQLRVAGLRPTRQRVAIAALLLDGRHRHVNADILTEEIAAAGLQEGFDASVFKGMERNYRQAPEGSQQRFRRFQPAIQLGEFIVNVDA